MRTYAPARISYEESTALYEQFALQSQDAYLEQRRVAHMNIALLVRLEDSQLGWPDYRYALHHLSKACRCRERFRGNFRDEKDRPRVLEESLFLFKLHIRN
jgi:hypothetical protein